MSFFAWSPDDRPGDVLPVTAEAGWNELRSHYTPRKPNAPFERIIEIAKSHGTRAVVVERRYIDLDYRSEHTKFYSTTFRRYPSVCHRLHFFADDIVNPLSALAAAKQHYIGYSVMRPIPSAPVGRTVLLPPPDLNGGAICLVTDKVHVWGHELDATGVPFVSQDAQYMRCAHSALWMVLYHAYLKNGLPRRLPGDIQEAATGGHVRGREVPSEGLSVGQMLGALHTLRMSGGPIKLPQTRAESRASHRVSLVGVLSRYVNSQLPPIVYSSTHAWVIVGYVQAAEGDTHDATTLFRHDDARGPYLRVDDPWEEPEEAHRPWKAAIPPLPQKLYMTGERAELVGSYWLHRRLGSFPDDHPVRVLDAQGDVTVRTYAIGSSEYKAGLTGRVPPRLEDFYRLAHMSRWIWVVELVSRARLRSRETCVLGEAIIDATASHLSGSSDRVVLGLRLWQEAVIYTPDHEKVNRVRLPDAEVDFFASGSDALRGMTFLPGS